MVAVYCHLTRASATWSDALLADALRANLAMTPDKGITPWLGV